MADPTGDAFPQPSIESAFCMACGYSLHGLASRRCPECGRPFDPGDPTTQSIGAPLRRWQRSLLKPMGWPLFSLPILGTAALAYLSGWPHLMPIPWSVLTGEVRWPPMSIWPLTAPDIIRYTSILLWTAFATIVILRRMLRMAVPLAARRANFKSNNRRLRGRVLALVFFVSTICIVFGWQHRISQRWIARVLQTNRLSPSYSSWNPSYQCPVQLTPEQTAIVLRASVINLCTARERTAALKLLVEESGRSALPVLIEAIAREPDPALRIWELRLIALCRDPATSDLVVLRLGDADPAMRAAAADAVGILRKPSYSIEVPGDFWIYQYLSLDSTPPIDVREIVSPPTLPKNVHYWSGPHDQHDLALETSVAINPTVQRTLLTMMLNGQTRDEREAAARTLVTWPPPDYQLRVAEWGVWTTHNGRMALAQSIIDEIPPFVHQMGNPLKSFDSYFLYPSMVRKPIVHVTSNTALAADVEVHIRQGRPWFAYPRPDDFGMGMEPDIENSPQPNLLVNAPEFDDPALASLPDCWEGYPWLKPHHRAYHSGSTTFGGTALGGIYRLGVRWQSVIISPERLSWMTLPEVPADLRFQWWSTLRQVPSSWATNRGETERFLYYDGPTRAPTPASVFLNAVDHTLHFIPPDPQDNGFPPRNTTHRRPDFLPLPAAKRDGFPDYEGMYMEVRAGILTGQHIDIPRFSVKPILGTPLPLQGDAVIQRLRQMIVSYGLTDAEANGLIAAWAPQWFKTEGRRFLLRISPSDYAELCPIQVRPMPTELVRLGLVLTEFDPKSTTLPATILPQPHQPSNDHPSH